MTALRYVGGFLLALAILPVMGLVWLGCVSYAGLTAIWTRFKEIWLSLADPAYIPNVGYGGTIRRLHECRLASYAAAHGDWATAVRHWKAAGRLYDVESMHRLGECFEAGRGVEANSGAAYEYYRLAAQYGMKDAKEARERLRRFRFSPRERRAFVGTMWI